MIGLLVIAHAPLGSALVACAEHVYGEPPAACRTIDVVADAEPAMQVDAAERAVAELDDGQGVLVLVDMLGATPGNVASQLASSERVAVVAGVNLPMLLRVLCYREQATLELLTDKAVKGGASGVEKLGLVTPQDRQRHARQALNPCEEPGDGHPRLQDQQ